MAVRNLFAAALAAAMFIGCAADQSEPQEDLDSRLNAQSDALWPLVDGEAVVPVCWMPPVTNAANLRNPSLGRLGIAELPMRQEWVREIVEAQWNALTPVKFVGWRQCGPIARNMVKLVPMDSTVEHDDYDAGQPHVEALGRFGRGRRVFLNMFFGDEYLYNARMAAAAAAAKRPVDESSTAQWWFPSACHDQLKTPRVEHASAAATAEVQAIFKSCLQNNVLHEFGHIAGLAHEQNRWDVPDACLAAAGTSRSDIAMIPPELRGNQPVGGFDSESIMSYCRTNRAATLSSADIAMVRQVYRGD